MKDKYFSTDQEPALNGGRSNPDPAEKRAPPTDSRSTNLEALRDSVANEPALPDRSDPTQWSNWLQYKRSRCGMLGNLSVTFLAAVLGGPFAIVGAIMAGQSGAAALVYVIVAGPVIEEILKQSGMTYLLEKKPYRIFASWQFLVAGIVSGLVFSVIENFAYIGVSSWQLEPEEVRRLAAFRWAACTPLHVVCSAIASLGLIRVWKKLLADGRHADLAAAFPFFATAMVIHGLYNLFAVLFGPKF